MIVCVVDWQMWTDPHCHLYSHAIAQKILFVCMQNTNCDSDHTASHVTRDLNHNFTITTPQLCDFASQTKLNLKLKTLENRSFN